MVMPFSAIEARRRAQNWLSVGRKIGFTNRTIWARYGVAQPLWASMWSHTMRFAVNGRATLDARRFVNPRIEPEVVFKLNAPVPLTDDPVALLSAVEWMAPGFEIVQSHFPDWKFSRGRLHGGVRAAWRAGGRRTLSQSRTATVRRLRNAAALCPDIVALA